jgi:hypothetical protein
LLPERGGGSGGTAHSGDGGDGGVHPVGGGGDTSVVAVSAGILAPQCLQKVLPSSNILPHAEQNISTFLSGVLSGVGYAGAYSLVGEA